MLRGMVRGWSNRNLSYSHIWGKKNEGVKKRGENNNNKKGREKQRKKIKKKLKKKKKKKNPAWVKNINNNERW